MMKTAEQRIQGLRERFRRLQESERIQRSAAIDCKRGEEIAERYRKRFATIRSAS